MLTNNLKTIIEQAAVSQDLKEYLDRNEQGDAELFALLHDNAVYDHAEKSWYLWRGLHWEADKKREIYNMMNRVAAEYLDRAGEERGRGNIESSKRSIERAKDLQALRRMTNVLTLATSLPKMALSGNEWDVPSMLLPVANGIINLASGEMREGKPADYVRSYSPVEWRGLDSPAPRWEAALRDIFNNNDDLIAFVQRLLGYAITGETKEQILPIFWGEGANGKSTIMDTLSAVLGGDICFNTQADSLMDVRANDGDGAKPFIVALRNKRLIWASESKEGQRLNAGLVKQLTGDGTITARALFGNPVTFRQTHKIIMLTNHCPRIPDSDDHAMWRRVIRVPFNVRFVDNPQNPNERKQNKDLLSDLRAEYSGILAWLVRGCLEWQKQGLNPPAVVIESTERYREDEDLTGQFCDERLIVREGCEVLAGELYRAYSQWCGEYGYNAMSARAFGQRMKSRFGETQQRWIGGKNQRAYVGVGLSVNS
ncbi:MAG: phage/plasmid primase, P4 family [Anaerolineales bacterium]|nr:phage/plasmid primase, P4 family [Anaerolineales bacterium]